jgi:drug/metabolite transporter (DMT)-like permease
MNTPPSLEARKRRHAPWLMLAAVATFAWMDVGLKLLAAHYPPMQVAALRGLASLPWVLGWTLATAGARALWPRRWLLHLLRGGLGVVMIGSFVYALGRMPMASAYALFFVAPLLLTALSGPLLGERVGPRRWAAIGAGMLGVWVVLRPSGTGMRGLAGMAVLLSALCYALSALMVRVLARRDSSQAITFWMLAMMAGGAGVLAWPDWVALHTASLWLVAAVGLAGALGQYAITEAFRHGEASLLAPLEYTALLWGVALDLALWGVLPDAMTWLGAAIIIGSGLYLLRREREHIEAEHP